MKKSLSSNAFSALRWNYLGLMARSASSLIIGIVLARLLGPKPFGEVAVALLVLGLAGQVADAGFGAALVQAPELSPKQIRVSFTVQMLAALALMGLTVVAAPWVALSFHDAAIRPVLYAIAPLFVLQALGQTSTGLLKRKLAFRAVQTAQVSSYLVGYLFVGIPAAYLGWGALSLVAAQLVQALTYSAQVYLRVRHSLVPSLDRSGAALAGYGGKVTGTNLANWSISNLDNAVVGSSFGSVALGLYSRAFNLASSLGDGITGSLQQVLFSGYSRTQGRTEVLRRTYLASIAFVAVVMFPAFWSLAACGNTVMVGLFGPKWSDAAPLFVPLALAMPVHAVMGLSGPVLWATNRVQQELRLQLLTLVVAAVAFGITTRLSVVALAWAVLVVYGFRWVMSRRVLGVIGANWGDLLRVSKGAIGIAAVASLALSVTNRLLIGWGIRPAWSLCALVVMGFCVWLAGIIGAAARVLPPELVEVGARVSENLPAVVRRFIDRAAARQQYRHMGVRIPGVVAD